MYKPPKPDQIHKRDNPKNLTRYRRFIARCAPQRNNYKIYVGSSLVVILTLLTGYGLLTRRKPTPKDFFSNSSSDSFSLIEEEYPKFIVHSPYNISELAGPSGQIILSKFGSEIGHRFACNFEGNDCVNNKHFFKIDPNSLPTVFCPVQNGTIQAIREEYEGIQLEIAIDGHPGWFLRVFHIRPSKTFVVGEKVAAGQILGRHYSDKTYSDFSLQYYGNNIPCRDSSIFFHMTDEVLAKFGLFRNDLPELLMRDADRLLPPNSCNDQNANMLSSLLGPIFNDSASWVSLAPPGIT
jgi:hypothetical protein